MPSPNDGRHEINAAKRLLAVAEKMNANATQSLEEARESLDAARRRVVEEQSQVDKSRRRVDEVQSQVDESRKELKYAKDVLKTTEKRWEVIHLDLDNESSSQSNMVGNGNHDGSVDDISPRKDNVSGSLSNDEISASDDRDQPQTLPCTIPTMRPTQKAAPEREPERNSARSSSRIRSTWLELSPQSSEDEIDDSDDGFSSEEEIVNQRQKRRHTTQREDETLDKISSPKKKRGCASDNIKRFVQIAFVLQHFIFIYFLIKLFTFCFATPFHKMKPRVAIYTTLTCQNGHQSQRGESLIPCEQY